MVQPYDPVIIRVGALPIRYWLMGASSEVFQTIDELETLTEASAELYQQGPPALSIS